jgi:hypothetical protein
MSKLSSLRSPQKLIPPRPSPQHRPCPRSDFPLFSSTLVTVVSQTKKKIAKGSSIDFDDHSPSQDTKIELLKVCLSCCPPPSPCLSLPPSCSEDIPIERASKKDSRVARAERDYRHSSTNCASPRSLCGDLTLLSSLAQMMDQASHIHLLEDDLKVRLSLSSAPHQ